VLGGQRLQASHLLVVPFGRGGQFRQVPDDELHVLLDI
jgi:hypothetical protein